MAQTPPAPPNNWEEEFFKKHNITDDKEKQAIRGRATVFAYDRARRKAEDEESAPKSKRWYED